MIIPHYLTCVMCHVSRVPCHLSRVKCHMSPVTCQKKNSSYFFFFSFLSLKKIGQSGGPSRWRVCYQRGLPRLVYKFIDKIHKLRCRQSMNLCPCNFSLEANSHCPVFLFCTSFLFLPYFSLHSSLSLFLLSVPLFLPSFFYHSLKMDYHVTTHITSVMSGLL